MTPKRFPTELADLCVQCGLCLPHCPTYQLERMESEGPRGRIAIMKGLASGQWEATPTGLAHLDHCLGCGQCERVCPAKVPYLELRDHQRASRPSRVRHWRAWALSTRVLARWRRGLLTVYALLPRGLLPRRWQPLARLVRARTRAGKLSVTPTAQDAGAVLHLGCQGPALDARAAQTCAQVLRALGAGAVASASEACCGALAQHEGALALAARQRQQLARDSRPLVALDSGCIADLRRAGRITHEACQWVLDHWPAHWDLQPVPLDLALHTPCTHRALIDGGSAARTLLAKIPGLRITPVTGLGCCGAGGAHMLDDPAHAQLFAQALWQDLPPTAKHLASTNIGCRAHLRCSENAPVIVHPLEILAASLGIQPLPDTP